MLYATNFICILEVKAACRDAVFIGVTGVHRCAASATFRLTGTNLDFPIDGSWYGTAHAERVGHEEMRRIPQLNRPDSFSSSPFATIL